MEQGKPILNLNGVTKKFSGLTAVNHCTLNVMEGQIHSLIGPNGAGKTTLFNLINRMMALTAGSIDFCGQDISRMEPHQAAKLGIGRTFQIVHLVDRLTILENVMLGAFLRTNNNLVSCGLGLPQVRRDEKRFADQGRKWLDFIGFTKEPNESVSVLSYGEQKVLEIARALMMEPKLLLLDEPAAGLNTQETIVISRLIRKIRDLGITVFLVEHDMILVMNISDKISVLNYGELLAEGSPEEIKNNSKVIDAYLGVSEDAEN